VSVVFSWVISFLSVSSYVAKSLVVAVGGVGVAVEFWLVAVDWVAVWLERGNSVDWSESYSMRVACTGSAIRRCCARSEQELFLQNVHLNGFCNSWFIKALWYFLWDVQTI